MRAKVSKTKNLSMNFFISYLLVNIYFCVMYIRAKYLRAER